VSPQETGDSELNNYFKKGMIFSLRRGTIFSICWFKSM